MKLVKAERSKLEKEYKWGKVQTFINEFIESGMDAAEVQYAEGEYSSVYSLATTLRLAIKRMHLSDTVKSNTIDGRCYLIRKDV